MVKLQSKYEYPNPPISEVAWEFRFEKNEEIVTNLDEFRKQIEDRFPIERNMMQQLFEFSGEKQNQARLNNPNIMGKEYLSDKSRKNIIRIQSDKLSLITTQHSTHEAFLELLNWVIQKFQSVFPLDLLTPIRLGLRYINIIELPGDDKNRASEYLNLPLDNHKFPMSKIEGLNFEILLNHDTYWLKTIYATTVIANSPKIVVDWDCFIDSNSSGKIENSNLLNQTTLLHSIIKGEFASLITEDFVTKVMER